MSAQEQLKELLRNTGREVAKEVGSHLKSVARDRAVSYAQDLIGEGLADEMGLAARSVGGTAFSSALSQMGDVKDAASARRVAGSVGRAAASDGATQLAGLAGMDGVERGHGLLYTRFLYFGRPTCAFFV